MSINEQDILLLSAYIDGELTENERVRLEARLQSEADLQAELDALQQTVTLVRAMPTLRAPRDYTLDPAAFEARPGTVLPFRFRTLTYAAAAVIVAVFGVVLFLMAGGSGDESLQSVGQDIAAEQVETQFENEELRQTSVAQAQQPTQEAALSMPTPTSTALPTPTAIPTMAAQGGAAAEPQSPPEPQQEEASQIAQGNVPADDGGAASDDEADGDVGQTIADTPFDPDDRQQVDGADQVPFSTNRADATLDEFYRDTDGLAEAPEEGEIAAGTEMEAQPDVAAEEGFAPPAGALDQAEPALPDSNAAIPGGRDQSLSILLIDLLNLLQDVFAAVMDALQ